MVYRSRPMHDHENRSNDSFPPGRETKQGRLVKLNLLQACDKPFHECELVDDLDIYDKPNSTKIAVLKDRVANGLAPSCKNPHVADEVMKLYDNAVELYIKSKPLNDTYMKEHRDFVSYLSELETSKMSSGADSFSSRITSTPSKTNLVNEERQRLMRSFIESLSEGDVSNHNDGNNSSGIMDSLYSLEYGNVKEKDKMHDDTGYASLLTDNEY